MAVMATTGEMLVTCRETNHNGFLTITVPVPHPVREPAVFLLHNSHRQQLLVLKETLLGSCGTSIQEVQSCDNIGNSAYMVTSIWIRYGLSEWLEQQPFLLLIFYFPNYINLGVCASSNRMYGKILQSASEQGIFTPGKYFTAQHHARQAVIQATC